MGEHAVLRMHPSCSLGNLRIASSESLYFLRCCPPLFRLPLQQGKVLPHSRHTERVWAIAQRRGRTADVAQRRYVELTGSISIRTGSTALSDVFAEPAWLAAHLNDQGVPVLEGDVSQSANGPC